MTNEDASRYERGAAKLREVYAGDVVEIPEGANAFNDVMLRTLFAEVWDRDEVLDIRARRLLIMGVIAARGQADTWKIQARAALIVPCEQVIGGWISEGEPAFNGQDPGET